jgi:glycosyltransferase involved in cell wall biosynthesis
MAPRLVILSSLPAIRRDNGDWLLPGKFVNGLQAYAERWPGNVVAGLQPGDNRSEDLDNEWHCPSDLPFELVAVDFRSLATRGDSLLENAVVMGIPHHELHGLARQCRARGSIFVANTELTLRTKLQIARAQSGIGPRLLKTTGWLIRDHFRVLREIGTAHGLQCNGTPTHDAYARYSPNPHLYFDSRSTADMLITPGAIDGRLERLTQRKRLNILFSGRLSPIKGAHHLVPMADALRRQGMDFELRIAGDGPLRQKIEQDICAHDLAAQVWCLGTLDFSSELMPMLHGEIDVFVCPHLQGDPSCTYIETMAAGVPIVGYDNEAWHGLHRRSGAGLVIPRKTPAALAEAVSGLAADTTKLSRLSHNARDFAAEHVFEKVFDHRIKHLKSLAQAAPDQAC